MAKVVLYTFRKHEARWKASPELANVFLTFLEEQYHSQASPELFSSLEKFKHLRAVAMRHRNKKNRSLATKVPLWYKVSPKSTAASHPCYYCNFQCNNKDIACYYQIFPKDLCKSDGSFYVYKKEGKEQKLCDQCWKLWIEQPYEESSKILDEGAAISLHDKQFWFRSLTVVRTEAHVKLCCNQSCEEFEMSKLGQDDNLYIFGPLPNHRLCTKCFSTSQFCEVQDGACACGFEPFSESEYSEPSDEDNV